MSAEFENSISGIKNAIESNKLVVFAGAGVSKDSGIPLWGELIEKIKGYLNEKNDEYDPLKIAQMLYNEKGEKEYNDIIESLIFKSASKYNPIHEAIFELNPQHIITTNYDYYFEDIIKDKGLPISVVSKDADLPYAKYKNLLIKYHGDFRSRNIVFKENDYLEFSNNNTLKETFVKSLFSNKVILFVGYRVGDRNLKFLIREIQYILKKHHQRSYLLSHRNDFSSPEKQYFNNLGINIIQFPSKKEDIINNISEDKQRLSIIGNKVYKTLKYISYFDLFQYERERMNSQTEVGFIDDLYISLRRFSYFRVLPERILKSLYPFNQNLNGRDNIEVTTLIDYEGKFHSILKNYRGKEDKDYKEEEKQKLNYILSRLISSNVYRIGIKGGAKDSLGNQRTTEEILFLDKYFTNDKIYDQLEYNVLSYRYAEVIKQIEIYEILTTSDLGNDLVFAYSLYQMGEFYKSFGAYKMLKMKANRLELMEVSFICSYNMQRIGLHIHGLNLNDNRYSFGTLKLINEEAKEIDLNEELLRVRSFLDKDVYKFLIEVKDGWYIQRLCNRIENLFIKVQGDVRNIERGGSSLNSHYFNLYNTIRQLNDFLCGSFILGNGFSQINDAFRKSIRTFILGFQIGNIKLNADQESFGVTKLEAFNSFLFQLILDYDNPKDLIDYLIVNKINQLKFDAQSQEQVVELITNFLSSAFEENKTFGGQRQTENFINYLNYNLNFRKKILRQFNNICIVLSYFEFSVVQMQKVYSNLNLFLKYTNFTPRKYSRYFRNVIQLRFEMIGVDLLKETLDILNHKGIQYERFYIELLKKVQALNPEFINNEFVIGDIKDVDYGKIRHDLFVIYLTLPENKKNSFMVEVRKMIMKHSEVRDFYFLILHNIPCSRDMTEKYKGLICSRMNVVKKENIDNIRLLRPIIKYFELIYLGLIEDKEFSAYNGKLDFFNFLIHPESFDEDKFDVNWLKFLEEDCFIERFSKITYILEKLLECLKRKFDSELSYKYFRLIK